MSDSLKKGLDIQETDFGGRSQSTQRRVIYFSSGETLEEEEEDSEEEEDDLSSRDAFTEPTDKAKLSWKNVLFTVWRRSLRTCDFLGERLAGLLGLNAAKYQYAIDQYHRDHKITSSQGTEEGLCEEGTERIGLSPRLGSVYGATSTLGCLADHQASNDKKCVDISKGAHNQGYQEEAEDHLK